MYRVVADGNKQEKEISLMEKISSTVWWGDVNEASGTKSSIDIIHGVQQREKASILRLKKIMLL